jgi:hypothetical protein
MVSISGVDVAGFSIDLKIEKVQDEIGTCEGQKREGIQRLVQDIPKTCDRCHTN